MKLSALEIKRLSAQDKDYWISDEKGLRLLVKRNGAKYWRLKYRYQGKQKTLALGVYPDVSLADARSARDKAGVALSEGVDPSQEKKLNVNPALKPLEDSERFSVLALAWWKHQRGTWTEDHAQRVWVRLRDNSFDLMDRKSMKQIDPQDILAVVRGIESRNALDVASRVLQDIRRVFRYGVQMGILATNPAFELSGIVRTRKTQHRASLAVDELGGFLCDLQHYHQQGRLLTRLALQLLIYTFVRPGELRGARWSEFDCKARLWRIPAGRMKMRAEHLVPLSTQAIAVLEEIKPITEQYDLVFPSERNRDECISDNTMRRAMMRMGYDGKILGKSKATPHGFRANAASILNEQGFNPDAVERQLSHMERNGVRAAYTHHARYLEERETMMQWWADYLDEAMIKAAQARLLAG